MESVVMMSISTTPLKEASLLEARLERGANAIKTTFIVVIVVNVVITSRPINKSSKKKKEKKKCGFASLSRPLYRSFSRPLLRSSAPSKVSYGN